MSELLHKGITDRILAAFYQVHRELGAGYLESVYANGMALALTDEGLRVDREVGVNVHFRGRVVGTFRADMIIESVVLLELKAGDRLDQRAEAQLLNYLWGTRLELGFILFFGPKASFVRRIMTNDRKLFP